MKKTRSILPKAPIVFFLLPILIACLIHWRWIESVADACEGNPNRWIRVETAAGPLIFDAAAKVPIIEPSPVVAETVVRWEDPRFWRRNGSLDLISIGGAVGDAIGGNPRGASTIPQQVARIENPWILQPEKSTSGTERWLARFNRKVLEVRIGDRALKSRGHKGVLCAYTSLVPSPAPGIESAALRQFGKPASELTLTEATAITALFPAPGRRSRDRVEWLAATQRRDPRASVPSVPAMATAYPHGSLLTHRDEFSLDPDLTRDVFLASNCHLNRHPILQDVGVVILAGGRPAALVDSARAGVRCPWAWSTTGRVRLNSSIKVFIAAEMLASGQQPAGLDYALEHSENEPFVRWGEGLGQAAIERRFDRCGLKTRAGFSFLGRCWTPPLELARAVDFCVRETPLLRKFLSEVPRRGTAASALRAWPQLPKTAWSKTGTSPSGMEFLIVGGNGSSTVLIWARATGPNHFESGQLLGPLFADLIRTIQNHPPSSCTSSALSSR